MPKLKQHETVLHDWVCNLTFQMQALLLTAMRGPDENNKFNAAKAIIRYLRGVVIKPAGEWANNPVMPTGLNDNDFMWGEYTRNVEQSHQHKKLPDRIDYIFNQYANEFWQDHDEYPHHFIMHLVHCAEVVGYKYPNELIRGFWNKFYLDACEAFHMNPETEEQMDDRLNDFGCGIHNH